MRHTCVNLTLKCAGEGGRQCCRISCAQHAYLDTHDGCAAYPSKLIACPFSSAGQSSILLDLKLSHGWHDAVSRTQTES